MVLGFAGSAFTAAAQTTSTKIGFADVDYIFSEMPEEKQIQTELQGVQTALKKQMDTKAAEFRQKLEDYQQNMNNMLPAVKANTERELQQLLSEALEQLKPVDKSAVVLSDMEGMSDKEIAAMLGLTVSAVKTRLHRARLFLRGKLAVHLGHSAA